MPDMPERLPARLYILGSLGALAIACGAASEFGGIDVVPAALQFEDYGATLMAMGAVLMIPELVHFLRRSSARDETAAEL